MGKSALPKAPPATVKKYVAVFAAGPDALGSTMAGPDEEGVGISMRCQSPWHSLRPTSFRRSSAESNQRRAKSALRNVGASRPRPANARETSLTWRGTAA